MDLKLADIQRAVKKADYAEAENLLVQFLSNLFPLEIATAHVRRDNLSLNSVNGFVKLKKPDPKTGACELFFKFHQEENEEALAEYYNSQLLADYGYPVEMPVYVSQEVGKQILLYPVKNAKRMADICKRLDFAGDAKSVIAAQEELDKISCAKYLETLHTAGPQDLAQEPIMQLFYNRLVDGRDDRELGGRYKSFYEGEDCRLPGATVNFADLQKFKWRINGLEYAQNLQSAFEKSRILLSPQAHGNYPAVVAHGDAHNGNVWFNNPHLSLFDPAFAGKNIPALLAEIKATFHNIFAHPLWLYDAQEADGKYDVSCTISGDIIDVNYDWQLSSLRRSFLAAKVKLLWQPLLKELAKRDMLVKNWQEYMRLSLFCCPTLVMNLRAASGSKQNSHTPKTSLLGFAIAIMLSSPPATGKDMVSEFFAEISP